MNKTIKQLNTDELYTLVRENMYEDLQPYQHAPNGLYFSHSNDVLALIVPYEEHATDLKISHDTYGYWIDEANKEGLTPLFICSTPLGIWQFNLDMHKPTASDDNVYFKIDKGFPILPWYPEYASEAEWVASVEDAYNEFMYQDPAEQDLESMIAELLNYDGDLDAAPLD